MNILVLSDSHGDLDAMIQAVEAVKPDCVLHLGDYWKDAMKLHERLGALPFYAVPGNCDMSVHAMDTRLLELEGVRIYMTHGHELRVKMSPLRAILAAQEAQARVLCFGHTHSALCEERDGLWILNPGACGGKFASYGVIEIGQSGGVTCRIQRIGGETI